MRMRTCRVSSLLAVVSLFHLGGCDKAATPTAAPRTSASAEPEPTRKEHLASQSALLQDEIGIKRQLTVELFFEPKQVVPGKNVALVVKLNIRPGWHIAPMGPATGPAHPTQFKLDLPTGVRTVGDWIKPQPSTSYDGR